MSHLSQLRFRGDLVPVDPKGLTALSGSDGSGIVHARGQTSIRAGLRSGIGETGHAGSFEHHAVEHPILMREIDAVLLGALDQPAGVLEPTQRVVLIIAPRAAKLLVRRTGGQKCRGDTDLVLLSLKNDLIDLVLADVVIVQKTVEHDEEVHRDDLGKLFGRIARVRLHD